MYAVLDGEEQNSSEKYPDWCDLSWFHNCRNIDVDVEPHYHDAPEIWLWHEGGADCVVGDAELTLAPGTMVYTPAGCIHSYTQHGVHSNTGIVPRLSSGLRGGHLHTQETGENPVPEMEPFWRSCPKDTPQNSTDSFPRKTFLERVYAKNYGSDEIVFDGNTSAWAAFLVRTGSISVNVGGIAFKIDEPQLLIVKKSVALKIVAERKTNLAIAVGRT